MTNFQGMLAANAPGTSVLKNIDFSEWAGDVPSQWEKEPTSGTLVRKTDREQDGKPVLEVIGEKTGSRLSQKVADALNDFGCRFDNNTLAPCTLTPRENYGFVASDTSTQFCTSQVLGHELLFQSGDTSLTAQWRDSLGNIGLARRIVVRVP